MKQCLQKASVGPDSCVNILFVGTFAVESTYEGYQELCCVSKKAKKDKCITNLACSFTIKQYVKIVCCYLVILSSL